METIRVSFDYLTEEVLFAYFPLSTLCMEPFIQLTLHIVEHNIILLPVLWNVSSRSFRRVESFSL